MRSLIVFSMLLFFVFKLSATKLLPQDPLDYFSSKTQLFPENEIDLTPWNIRCPGQIIKEGALLIAVCNRQDNLLHILNLQTGDKEEYIPRSNGPQDALGLTSLSKSGKNKIAVLDTSYNKIIEMDLSVHASSPNCSRSFYKLPTTVHPLSLAVADTIAIITGLYPDARFYCKGYRSSTVIKSGAYPQFPGSTALSGGEKSLLFAHSIMKLSPGQQKMVWADCSNGMLDIYSVSNKRQIQKFKSLYFNYPSVLQVPKDSLCHSGQKTTFCDIATSEAFFYALYSGKEVVESGHENKGADYLLVFDWNGMPVRAFALSVPLTCISYDVKENAIYGISNAPEATLVKYSLTTYLGNKQLSLSKSFLQNY